MSIRRDLAVVPLPPTPPSRFERYDPAIMERAFELWSFCGRHGSRTLRLLRRELGDDAQLPDASTIRRWATEQGWSARADADLERTHGRDLFDLQVGWLSALKLAQQTLMDAMAGEFDELPFGGAGRIKSAEITLRTLERAGPLVFTPQTAPDAQTAVDWESLSTEEKEQLAREITQGRKQRKTTERSR